MLHPSTKKYASKSFEYAGDASLLEGPPLSMGTVVSQVFLLVLCFAMMGAIIAAAGFLLP